MVKILRANSREPRAKSQEPRTDKYAILLAGGQGSRFWPQSRTLEPKQFLSLLSPAVFGAKDKVHNSLFEQALARTRDIIAAKNIFIATSELYRYQMLELIKPFKIPPENILFEPDSRNTAVSIAACCRIIQLREPLAKVCVFPCDHLIRNGRKFRLFLNKAFRHCRDNLVVFGIPPSRPATGYGYIRAKTQELIANSRIYNVEKFTEKPGLRTAEAFLKSGIYYWNSGIFVGAVSVFMEEFRLYSQAIYSAVNKAVSFKDVCGIWRDLPSISFDYAVLERSRRILMVKASSLGWSDLGNWQAWDELFRKDNHRNVIKGDVVSLESSNITVFGNNRLIAGIGLKDLIIVDTPDALLVTRKDRAEEVKKVFEKLKGDNRQEHYLHRTVRRPWGKYTVLDIGSGFKIKLVEVNPMQSLSLQLHRRRSEHWVVVKGRAKVIEKGGKSRFITENQSTFIPASCVHRLSNPGSEVLRLVEVQTGKYLEEDDIIRLEDTYGRLSER